MKVPLSSDLSYWEKGTTQITHTSAGGSCMEFRVKNGPIGPIGANMQFWIRRNGKCMRFCTSTYFTAKHCVFIAEEKGDDSPLCLEQGASPEAASFRSNQLGCTGQKSQASQASWPAKAAGQLWIIGTTGETPEPSRDRWYAKLFHWGTELQITIDSWTSSQEISVVVPHSITRFGFGTYPRKSSAKYSMLSMQWLWSQSIQYRNA